MLHNDSGVFPQTSGHKPGEMASRPGWVVVHDSARDFYQLPLALAEGGSLERFVTDWYTPLEKPVWSRLAKSRLARSTLGIHSRYRAELPSALVTDQKLNFISSLAVRRFLRRPYRDEIEGAKAGRLARKIALRAGAPLLATSYSAAAAFRGFGNGLKVLFQVHPHPRSLRRLYAEMMSRDPDYAGLGAEPEASAAETALRVWEEESSLADHVLCASQFSRRSLLAAGIRDERISVIPYGVDSKLFRFGRPEKDAPFTVLFVGQKVARKGLRSLVRAWSELGLGSARLILAGGHVRDQSLLSGFEGAYQEVPRTSLQELVELYRRADLFVLPSAAEGFGHVYLEALSCGTPILCTENTGGADIIREGHSGWVLPVGDREPLKERLAWCATHRSILREMREEARRVAERHTWEKFRGGIRGALSQVRLENAASQSRRSSTGEIPSSGAFWVKQRAAGGEQ
ncbi:glycosyltransferase family 4 protein [Acidobacteria bacterium AB60]|nr:glycosyltransferase family 4 protein [Acidobacteria bacterium AB60]